MYIHVHDCMKLSEHVHTCLYHVQTRMYRFANSCPGGQDSRWRRSMTRIWNSGLPRTMSTFTSISKEDYDINVFFDMIEYSNLDIDVTVFDIVVTKKTSISTKRDSADC